VIKIKIKQTESDCLIEVHGHARYAPIGKDIVCSAISVLFLTLANSIDETSDALCRYYEPDKDSKTLYISSLDLAGELAINFFRIGCKGTEEAYPECVELRDV
jgi:uncharacterized protein YsxB (DUF464 family)